MDQVEVTDPAEFIRWVRKEAFDLCIKAIAANGGRFGAPLLFGLDKDSSTHHANVMTFWSNDNKERSVELMQNLVESHGYRACAAMFVSELTRDGVSNKSLLLVSKIKDAEPRAFIRVLNEDNEFGEVEEIPQPEGILTKFWK
jgi:hypothetical protein